MKINLKVSCIFVIILVSCLVKAQEIKPGSNAINVGISPGFGFYYSGNYSKISYPPITMGFEHGLRDDIGPGVLSVGGFISMAGSRYRNNNNEGYNYSLLYFGPKANYYYRFIDEVETYAGLALFAAVSKSTPVNDPDFDPNGSFWIYPSLYIGGRYYLQTNMAVYSEIGFGYTFITVGVTFPL